MRFEPIGSLLSFVQNLSKTETHLHLEGAIPYEFLHALDARRRPALPAFQERRSRYRSLPDFEKLLLDRALPWLTRPQRYHDAAALIFAGHVAQNVKYVEVSFHLPVVNVLKVPGREIISAIKAATPPGVGVRVFAGILRSDIVGPLRPVIDQLHEWEDLAGVDLHGFEQLQTESDTAEVWSRLRAAGKLTKCHCGEFDGAAWVREAIEQLGVTRIGRGVRVIEDPAVVRLAIERDVTFDVCPISNVGLCVVSDLASHPLRQLGEAGVRRTISTDDPLCFASSVNEEYLAIAHGLNFTRRELVGLARNEFEVALLSPAQKRPWLDQLDSIMLAQRRIVVPRSGAGLSFQSAAHA